MTDEATPSPQSPAPAAKRKRWTPVRMAGLAFAAVVVVVLGAVLWEEPSGGNLIWMTPTQYAQSLKPGPFTAFKDKLKNWTAPVWRKFRRSSPQVMIDCRLLSLTTAAVEQINLQNPITNAAGGCAWILAPDEAISLRGLLKTNPAVSVISNPRVITGSRMQASMFTGNATPVAGVKLSQPTGISIDLIPIYSSDSIQLTVNVSATASIDSATNGMQVRTNFAAACQAFVPNGGSMVLDGGPPRDADAKRYWMVISPTAVDAKGKPIPKKP